MTEEERGMGDSCNVGRGSVVIQVSVWREKGRVLVPYPAVQEDLPPSKIVNMMNEPSLSFPLSIPSFTPLSLPQLSAPTLCSPLSICNLTGN